jgi:group I intron endonuclease
MTIYNRESRIKEEMGCIYRIINKIDGKAYVGQYCKDNPKQRFTTHKRNARNPHSTEHLYRAIRKHGVENFEFTTICVCKNEELNDLEIKYIKEYDTFGENGYNMTSGGQGIRNFKHSPETIERLREASTGKFPDDATRKRISEGLRGHGCSDETREKLRKAATGVAKKPETIEKLRIASTGRIVSKETCNKLSCALKGKSKSEDHIKKIKEAKRKLTVEDIQYIRENPDGLTGVQLAEKFNSSRASISRIINNKRYVD